MKLEIHHEDYSIRLKLLNVKPDEFTLEYTCLRINDDKRGDIGIGGDGDSDRFLHFNLILVRSIAIQEIGGYDLIWLVDKGATYVFVLYLPGDDNDKPRTITRTFRGADNMNRKIIELFLKQKVLSKIKLL